MAALPLTSKLSQASNKSRTNKVITQKYGNGYEQRARDGINYTEDKWQLSWEALTLSEFQTVQNALDAAAGVDYFTWTPFGESVSKKWVQDGQSSLQPMSGGLYSITVPMRQVFDL